MMRALIAIVCVFTPILGWITLLYFMDPWATEDAAKAKLNQLKAARVFKIRVSI